MTKKEIDQVFTKIILECLKAGYVINSQTFMGSDGTARIDMRKNKLFIRIFLKNIYGSGRDSIQLAKGTLKEIQKDLWISASGNPDIEKKLV